ncbi:MAG UNVERIFIED_CONTAM: hypothetical protein LVR18_29705 [Planctomycetaceae bacterium]|jgi:hypothetical protein
MTAEVRPRIAEDWLAIIIGGLLVLGSIAAVLMHGRQTQSAPVAKVQSSEKPVSEKKPAVWSNPLKPYLGVPGKWQDSPLEGLKAPEAILGVLLTTVVMFGAGISISGGSVRKFLPGFLVIFLLGMVAYVMAEQIAIREAGLEYALWALLLGLMISNTIGAREY